MVKIKKQYNKKYKIMDVKINKQLKNDEIILRCIHTGGTDVDEPPKPSRKTMEERMSNVIKEFVPGLINVALKPIVTRLDRIELTLKEHGNRLDKQDEFNQEQRKLNERFIEYMDKHP